MQLRHTLSDGQAVIIELKRSAKKNIILRPLAAGCISVNIPPYLSERALLHWLRHNEHLLQKMLAYKSPAVVADEQPATVWYRGEPHTLHTHNQAYICHEPMRLWLPESPWPQQKQHLRSYLAAHAADMLLPRLQQHSRKLALFPASMALSNAKTFWGVCRHRTGIRLNWRLIGAPDFVIDYVCIHELCHLSYPDHSPQFWAAVSSHTPHTQAAKQWLKQHGSALFVLG